MLLCWSHPKAKRAWVHFSYSALSWNRKLLFQCFMWSICNMLGGYFVICSHRVNPCTWHAVNKLIWVEPFQPAMTLSWKKNAATRSYCLLLFFFLPGLNIMLCWSPVSGVRSLSVGGREESSKCSAWFLHNWSGIKLVLYWALTFDRGVLRKKQIT